MANPLSEESYELVPAYLKEKRHCVHCRRAYYEAENLGQLRCRLHPGVIVEVDGGPETRYSCCGIRAGYFVVENPDSRIVGCLRADHMDHQLVINDAERRLQQVRERGTAVVPQLLYEFGVRTPLNGTVIYRLPCFYSRQKAVVLRLTQPALVQAAQNYRRLHRRAYETVALGPQDVGGGDNCQPAEEELFDVNAVLLNLEQQSHDQPLFDAMLTQSQLTERQTQQQCDLVWTDKLIRQSRQTAGRAGDARTIDFTLVRRIGTALDLGDFH